MLREFQDQGGRHWRVWDVNPMLHARKSTARPAARLKVPEAWLCFEAGDERRRLSPIPPDWETADVRTLEQLWRSAEVVPSPALQRVRIPKQD
jgi:hypothetical protein